MYGFRPEWVDLRNVLGPVVKDESEEDPVAEIQYMDICRDASQFSMLRAVGCGRPEEFIPEGKYTRLLVGGRVMMTDTPHEKNTNEMFLKKLHQVQSDQVDVLIAGLGLGMVLLPALLGGGIGSVVVLENNLNVKTAVEPQLREYLSKRNPLAESKLLVLHEDVFEWEPKDDYRWDVIYFDIWPGICVDSLGEIARLKEKYESRLCLETEGAWMGAWMEDLLQDQATRTIPTRL